MFMLGVGLISMAFAEFFGARWGMLFAGCVFVVVSGIMVVADET
jgi:hypothetical protein